MSLPQTFVFDLSWVSFAVLPETPLKPKLTP